MKKWEVEITFVIQVETREGAWKEARRVIEERLRGLANVRRVSLEPIEDPNNWIALNEPIQSKR